MINYDWPSFFNDVQEELLQPEHPPPQDAVFPRLNILTIRLPTKKAAMTRMSITSGVCMSIVLCFILGVPKIKEKKYSSPF